MEIAAIKIEQIRLKKVDIWSTVYDKNFQLTFIAAKNRSARGYYLDKEGKYHPMTNGLPARAKAAKFK